MPPASDRHIHTRPIPRLGGVAIFLTLWCIALLAHWIPEQTFSVVERPLAEGSSILEILTRMASEVLFSSRQAHIQSAPLSSNLVPRGNSLTTVMNMNRSASVTERFCSRGGRGRSHVHRRDPVS